MNHHVYLGTLPIDTTDGQYQRYVDGDISNTMMSYDVVSLLQKVVYPYTSWCVW